MTSPKKTAAIISGVIAGLMVALGGGGAGGFFATSGAMEATYATKAELVTAKETAEARLETKTDKIEVKLDKLADQIQAQGESLDAKIDSLRRDLWRQGERDRFTSTKPGENP